MHDTAAAFGAAFFRCYADALEGARILEVGAGDVNGTLRGCAPHHSKYTGIDVAAGPGVDVVLSDPYTYPFEPATYDIVVSTSCLEHDQMFWLSFAEMCRVLKAGGFIYLNVPSNGIFHRYPTDNWRFYPDSGVALAEWGRRSGHDIRLVESFIGRRRLDVWNDCVMVFGKGDTPRQLSLLAEIFPRSLNIRVGEKETFTNYCEQTEDMTLRAWLIEKLRPSSSPNEGDNQTSPIEALIVSVAEREVALGASERAAAERSAAAEAQIAALRSEVAEREATLVRAEAKAVDLQSALDAELRRAESETSDMRTALYERFAAMQRAGRQIAAVHSRELAERDATLARTKEAADEREAELSAGLAEREAATAIGLQHAEELARAKAETIDLRGALGELDSAVARRQNELAATRTALARAEAQAQAQLVSGRDELAGARAALAQAEAELVSRRGELAATRTAFTQAEAELASRREELAAAREVGRSLLAALRTDPVLTPADQPVRQPRGIFRLIGYWTGRARR